MCCGFGFGGYPDPGGYVISSLKKGDEITLEPGLGSPESKEKRTLVIYGVYGFSALCTNGTKLNCHDGAGVVKTGRTVEAKPGIKALLALLHAQVVRLDRWITAVRNTVSSEVWWKSYQIRKKFQTKNN